MTDHVLQLADAVSGAPLGNKHNRWHPAIPAVLKIASGDTVEIQTLDASDGQIRKATHSDGWLQRINLGRAHALTGPIDIEDAAPGDLLEVEILSIETVEEGFTATLPGRGFIPDLFPGPVVTFWDLIDGYATSDQIRGVRIPAAPFMGILGVAPSLELLHRVNAREHALAATGAAVALPSPDGALPDDPAISTEAWRTTAAHETGGNMDIRQLGAGASVYFPVEVPGALFSVGDGHFAQGDGETCGTAIETGTTFKARFTVHKGEATRRNQTNPTFRLARKPPQPALGEIFATTAISVTDDDSVSYLDASLAARNAVTMMVDAIVCDYGVTPWQAYAVISVAGNLSISSIVNIPHAQVTLSIDRGIFVDT